MTVMPEQATSPNVPTPDGVKKRPRRRIDLRQYGILAALAVIILLFQILTEGRLLYPGNVANLIQQNAYVLILAMGMVIVIIAGHIDLSVGSVVATVGAVAALSMNEWGLPWGTAVVLSLIVGALIGAWQGFWVAFVGIPAFIVTLAGMLVFRGVALVLLTGGTISGLPAEFNSIGSGNLPTTGAPDLLTLGIGALVSIALVVQQLRSRATLRKLDLLRERGVAFWIRTAIAVFAIMYLCYLLAYNRGTPIILIILATLVLLYSFLLTRTVFGRHVYAMGGNLFAAMMSGVKTQWVNFFIFVNMGLLAGLAGVVSTARAGSAVASAGQSFELDAIAAVFIGGAAVQGGVGTVVGAVIGGLVMGVLNQGLSILSVDAAWQQVIKGLVLLLAVAFDVYSKRRSGR
ncbi:Xylose transport system permease protein XylH [Clavibacter michiganensis]|uniref:Xylose transport system permease protein XylH n=1 Tax=Clavibacter michiganensis TaxID=28447 RepID=A0A251Y9S3_9MICO|nr:multiple monosaccharide ABC transporter permease [Clavibacter michiganensis]OUE21001.1 Xylose transport system permease protein XylH [Clavibacter michiganensis]